MFRTFWICQGCLSRTSLTATKRLSRTYSSSVSTSISLNDSPPISPALIRRARALFAEHTQLSQAIANSFDSRSAKRVGELTPVATALKDYDSAQDSLSELQNLLSIPDLEPELRHLAIADHTALTTEIAVASRTLLQTLIPPHPFAQYPCLLEIRPGAGGSEASHFASDLLRMYLSLCTRLSLPHSLLSYADTDGGSHPEGSTLPLQEAILEIHPAGAYDIFRTEAGVHRVQRVPATESKGRTHTSAASVLVLPSLPETSSTDEEEVSDHLDPTSDYYIPPGDVRTDVYRARGAGGQHVNTTDSAVRLTHIPTGTVVSMQDNRSQMKNREKAWRILRGKVAQARREEREEEIRRIRRAGIGVARMGRGDKIRTYNWGQQRVTDHRTGGEEFDLRGVVAGGEGLTRLMDGVRAWLGEREVEGMMAVEMEEEKTTGRVPVEKGKKR